MLEWWTNNSKVGQNMKTCHVITCTVAILGTCQHYLHRNDNSTKQRQNLFKHTRRICCFLTNTFADHETFWQFKYVTNVLFTTQADSLYSIHAQLLNIALLSCARTRFGVQKHVSHLPNNTFLIETSAVGQVEVQRSYRRLTTKYRTNTEVGEKGTTHYFCQQLLALPPGTPPKARSLSGRVPVESLMWVEKCSVLSKHARLSWSTHKHQCWMTIPMIYLPLKTMSYVVNSYPNGSHAAKAQSHTKENQSQNKIENQICKIWLLITCEFSNVLLWFAHFAWNNCWTKSCSLPRTGSPWHIDFNIDSNIFQCFEMHITHHEDTHLGSTWLDPSHGLRPVEEDEVL